MGLILQNLWDGRSVGHNYVDALFKHMSRNKYHTYDTASDSNRWVFTKHTNHGITAVVITVEDFLIFTTTLVFIEELYRVLSLKYAVKRLGMPVDFIGWAIRHRLNGAINLSQTSLVQTKIENTDMTENGRCTPYNTTEELYPPVEGDQNFKHNLQVPKYCRRYEVHGRLYPYRSNIREGKDWRIHERVQKSALGCTESRNTVLTTESTHRPPLLSGTKRLPGLHLPEFYRDSIFVVDARIDKPTSGAVPTHNVTNVHGHRVNKPS